MRLIVYAVNVHQGGGAVLLNTLLFSISQDDVSCIAFLDRRLKLSDVLSAKIKINLVAPSIPNRLLAERVLKSTVKDDDVVLFFGNLPPLFKLRGHVVVFVQNRYLVDDVKLDGFPFNTMLRLRAERLWLSCWQANADEFIVQTPSMKRLLEARTKGRIPVRVMPFMAAHDGYMRKVRPPEMQKGKDFDFLYVASGEPHKNHRQLIEAWCLLAKEGLFPSLRLTLDRAHFAELCSWMEQKIEQCRLDVENVGSLPHGQIKQLYGQAGALIYPSTFESFGLPLIEARQAGLPVLAAELDYVRDVLDPEQSFDPDSPVSIARAVKRYMGMDEVPLQLLDAQKFMHCLLERQGQSCVF